ncbi:MAG: AMP-binding protein [Chloroflexota bacterium]|nr:AMP-binding protein [Chloroflexota bacterium]
MSDVYVRQPWLEQYPAHIPATLPAADRSALAVFEETVRGAPDAPAIYYFDTVLSFGELDALANAFAAALVARDVCPGDRVALSLQNVPAFPLAVYAAWKCGAVVVPLSPMLREAELTPLLRDAAPRVLISLSSLLDVALPAAKAAGVECVIAVPDRLFLRGEVPSYIPRDECPPPEIEDLGQLLERFRGEIPPSPSESGEPAGLGPDDIAYIVYTSGTTGSPKGAMNTHANVVYTAEVYRVWAGLGPGDVILASAPLFHITGLIAHLAASAASGIPLILTYRFEPGTILRQQSRRCGTFTCMAITAFIALLDCPELPHHDLRALSKAYSGGAPIPPAVATAFRERTGVTIYPVYGLTETTSPSHAVPLGLVAPLDPTFGALSIGLPVPGAQCRVVDPDTGEPVGPGETGELLIRGPMVVPGYWERPGETEKALIDGWLRTGDIASMDEKGWFYIVDRLKDMIVASGYKVWPREVEEALFAHEAVREAAVVGAPDAYRGETVRAFVSLCQGAHTSPESLIAFCRERLSAYKVPRTIEIVGEIPKTSTGKFARRLLRERV